MICHPNAKINLGLHIVNKREDGFHNIETVFFPVGFSDILECVENRRYARSNKCVFIQRGLETGGDPEHNLVVKAYRLLDKKYDLPPVISHLYKILPTGAGLGGGSSDAAHMIGMLNTIFSLGLSEVVLEEHASELGSDCAFFIRNKPAYVFGKGHELELFSVDLKGYYLVLVNTGAHSNTALAYKHAGIRGVNGTSLKQLLRQPVDTWKQYVENDFEESVFISIPELDLIKQWLYRQGAIYAAMSGSGSTMFGIFREQPELRGKWKAHVVFEELIP